MSIIAALRARVVAESERRTLADIAAAEELLREHAYRDHYAEGQADNDELRRALATLRPMLDRVTDAPEWQPPVGDMD